MTFDNMIKGLKKTLTGKVESYKERLDGKQETYKSSQLPLCVSG